MPRNFEPSKYQLDIFDYIEHGTGNLVIEACAGSGKTSTIIESLEYIPKDKNVLLVAFNTDIVKELKSRVKGKDNINVSTCHSLGLRMLQSSLPDKGLSIETYKYSIFIRKNLNILTPIKTYSLGNNFKKYRENIETLVDLGRAYLCESIKDINAIARKYGIEPLADEVEVALKVMEWGREELDVIDFADMVWLPNILDISPRDFLYDFIYIDEAQDLNKAQRELILKCRKENTRIISAGDQNQCLYTFNGADPDSFKELKAIPNTVSMPLSITYRCADTIVDFAQKIVPSIEKNTDGRQGKIDYDVSVEEAHPGDMILCRNNAPLAKVYNQLIKEGKKAMIRGKDIGSNLITLLKLTKQKRMGDPFKSDGVIPRLYAYLFDTRDKIMTRNGIDEKMAWETPFLANLLDSIRAIEILSEGIDDAEEVEKKIKSIFGDNIKTKKNEEPPIFLSTVHKAKGLEADNVFIACPSLMPSKRAKLKWEIQQEYNLMYVAYTRARNRLAFLDESDFTDFDLYNSGSMSSLKAIETMVKKILRKEKLPINNVETARTIVNNATTIKQPVKRPVVIKTLDNNKEKRADDILKRLKPASAKNKKWF